MNKKTLKTFQKAVFSKLKKYKSIDVIKQIGKNDSIVYYGENNDLPNKYIQLLDESVYHDAAVKSKAMYYQGDGLTYENETDLPEVANKMGQSYNDINEKVSKDYSLFGGFALIVIWTIDSIIPDSEPTISEIYHQPFQDVRAEEANEFGVVDNYFVSRKWRERNTIGGLSRVIEQAQKIPSFNPNSLIHEDGMGNVVTEAKQIMVFKGSSFSSQYYPDPDYRGGLNNIVLSAELIKMKLSYTSRAIINGLHVKYIGDVSADELQELATDFDKQMAGALNAGNPMFSQAKEPGQGFVFEPITTGSESNVFTDYETQVMNAILAAHSITFKEAIGVEPEGKGLSAQEVEEKFTIFFNTVIRKGQQKILSGWNRLTPFIGSGLKFELNKTDILEGLMGDVDGDTNVADENEDTNDIIPTA